MISLLTLISFENNKGVSCNPLNLSLEIDIFVKLFLSRLLFFSISKTESLGFSSMSEKTTERSNKLNFVLLIEK